MGVEVWDLTKETIHLSLGCLQGGEERTNAFIPGRNHRVNTTLQAAKGFSAYFCTSFRYRVRTTPLCPYGTAYRRGDCLSTPGVCKKSLFGLLDGCIFIRDHTCQTPEAVQIV